MKADVHLSHRSIVDWLLPWLLGAVLAILSWIGANIHEMTKTLAVAVTRVDGHEERLKNGEERDRTQDIELQDHAARIGILEHSGRRR